MNCQEINFRLDSHPKSELDADTNREIENHIASCESCRDAWAAFDAIASKTIPDMPHGLGSRVAAALVAQAPGKPRRMRQSTLIGGVLIFGAAVAASIVLRTEGPTPDMARIDEAPPVAASESPQEPLESRGAEELSATAAVTDEDDDSDSAGDKIDPRVASAVALDPYSVAVIVTRSAAAQPDAIAEFEECHGQVLADLSAVTGINVIAGERVAAFEGLDLDAAEIARGLGAGVFVDIHMSSELGSCRAYVVDTTTDDMLDGFGGGLLSDLRPGRLQSIIADFVRRVEDKILEAPDTVSAEALANFFNTALGDNERVRAILSLRTGRTTTPLSGVLDEPIKAVLTQITMTSSDATARSNAIYALRGTTDPDLIEPLLYALANDTDEGVRRNAAYALHYLVDEPGVRNALERARSEDPSAQRGEGCCIQTVREAAQRSLLSDEAVIELTIETFMSDALGPLTDRERLRLLTTSPDGRTMFPYPLPEDAANALYEIGVRAADSELRVMVWAMLGWTGLNSEFAQTLVEDLVTHPNEDVQRSAVIALTSNVDEPEVRDIVQRALSEDLSAETRQTLNSVLQGDSP